MTGTVTAMVSNKAATIDDAKAWVKAMGERGKFSATSWKYRVAAIEALESMLAPEDDHSAQALLDNVDTIAADWARKNNGDGKTMRNHRGSVRSSLKLYLAYLADPAKAQAQFESLAAKPTRSKAKAAPTTEELPLAPSPASGAPAPLAAHKPVTPQAEMRSYPLSEGRVVQFRLPEKFTTVDLAKLSCHLATYCEDFDPTRPNAGVLSIMRSDERKS